MVRLVVHNNQVPVWQTFEPRQNARSLRAYGFEGCRVSAGPEPCVHWDQQEGNHNQRTHKGQSDWPAVRSPYAKMSHSLKRETDDNGGYDCDVMRNKKGDHRRAGYGDYSRYQKPSNPSIAQRPRKREKRNRQHWAEIKTPDHQEFDGSFTREAGGRTHPLVGRQFDVQIKVTHRGVTISRLSIRSLPDEVWRHTVGNAINLIG